MKELALVLFDLHVFLVFGRAKLHGWQDTYVFTKAMGEMVINCMRGEVPVVTIRPSVIESTWRDPFPGWMEGNRYLKLISAIRYSGLHPQ